MVIVKCFRRSELRLVRGIFGWVQLQPLPDLLPDGNSSSRALGYSLKIFDQHYDSPKPTEISQREKWTCKQLAKMWLSVVVLLLLPAWRSGFSALLSFNDGLVHGTCLACHYLIQTILQVNRVHLIRIIYA